MTSTDTILDVLRTIPDPEMPISIVDLGLIERVRIDESGPEIRVDIDVLPTFVGCPALPMIESDIREKVGALEHVGEVQITFINDPPWSVDRITPAGRASLKSHGVTVPDGDTADLGDTVPLGTSAIPCPFCESNQTQLDSPFGPTRCRMIFYCNACKNTFEHMKRV